MVAGADRCYDGGAFGGGNTDTLIALSFTSLRPLPVDSRSPGKPSSASVTVTSPGGMVTRCCVTMCPERRLARHSDMVTQRRVTMPPPYD